MMIHPNLVELARASVSRFASRPLFGERAGRTWTWTTYAAWQAHVDGVRAGLADLGVRPGDRVAIVSRNSAAWATAAYAAYGLGAAFVPMYEKQRPDEWEFILRDCGATVVFARTPAIAATLAAMRPRVPALRHVVTIEAPADDPASLAALERDGRARPVPSGSPSPDDVAGLIYTSGTTGLPKGVMLTHHNLTSNVAAALATFPMTHEDRTVSFLPWAHVYGQVCELHILIAAGGSTAFNAELDQLPEDLRSVRPTILVAVPRIFNKLHASIRGQIETRPRVVRRVFRRGLAASIARRRGAHLGWVDRIVLVLAGVLFAAIRRKLGGRLRYAISASATLSLEVAEFIDGLGIAVYEGYGLTETSPGVAMNAPGHRKLGSVGRALPGVTIEIDERRGETPGEGEIVVHGPNVMKGYHARPDENAQAFSADGGLRTGDLGHVDADGYLFITGRLKEQYKLENGKYVMPSPIEERLALSPFITNVMLYGDGRPFNVALVAIDVQRVGAWAAERELALGPDLAHHPRVIALVQEELAREGKDLRGYERPRAVVLTVEPFSIENGLLTPTLKLKRREVIARWGAALDALYGVPPAPAVAPPATELRHSPAT